MEKFRERERERKVECWTCGRDSPDKIGAGGEWMQFVKVKGSLEFGCLVGRVVATRHAENLRHQDLSRLGIKVLGPENGPLGTTAPTERGESIFRLERGGLRRARPTVAKTDKGPVIAGA